MATNAFDALTDEQRVEIYRELLAGGVAFTRVFMQDMSAFIVGVDVSRGEDDTVIAFSRCDDPNSWDVAEVPTIRYESRWVIDQPVIDAEIEAAGFEFVRSEMQVFGPSGPQLMRVWKLREASDGD